MKSISMKFTSIIELCTGKFLNLYKATYTSRSGRVKHYEIVSRRPLKNSADLTRKTPDAVTIICYNKDRTKMLIQKEFRMSVNDYVWDLPSGLIDAGETPEIAAARELKEETGLTYLKTLFVCPACYTSVGMSNELIVPIYCVADGEITGSDNELEITEPVWITKEEAKQLFEKTAMAYKEHKPYIAFTNRTSAELYRWLVAKTPCFSYGDTATNG